MSTPEPVTEVTRQTIHDALSSQVITTRDRLLHEIQTRGGLSPDLLHARAREIMLEQLLQDFTATLAKAHNIIPSPRPPPRPPQQPWPEITPFSGDHNTRSHTVTWFLRQVETYVSARGPRAIGVSEDDKKLNTVFSHLAKSSRQDRARTWMLSWIGVRTGIDLANRTAPPQSFGSLTWNEFYRAFREEFDPEFRTGHRPGQSQERAWVAIHKQKEPESAVMCRQKVDHSCNVCGEQFSSGNALHKHLRERYHHYKPRNPRAATHSPPQEPLVPHASLAPPFRPATSLGSLPSPVLSLLQSWKEATGDTK
jgi:hypothetical protein